MISHAVIEFSVASEFLDCDPIENHAISSLLFGGVVGLGFNPINIAKSAVNGIENGAKSVANSVEDGVKKFGEEMKSAVNDIENGAKSVANSVEDRAKQFGSGIISLVNDLAVKSAPLSPLSAADPTAVASWWAGRTPSEQQALLASDYDTLGQLHGLPATVLDTANRHRLSDHIASLNDQLNSPLLSDTDRAALQHQLDQDKGIQAAADQIGPGQPPAPVLLLRYDPTGIAGQSGAELAFGNPDIASNTAVIVPGTGSNASKFQSLTGNASDLYQQMSGGTGTKAVVTWLDGAEPQSIVPDAALDVWANADTNALVADLNGLRAAHASASGGDEGHLTAIGHSYGSYILGRALSHGARVDDAIFIGSPGVGVNHASDLGVDPQHVWDGQTGDDPILYVAKRFTPDPLTGNNPEDSDFGAQHFSVDGSHGHSEYFQGESLTNMARIASGDYTAVDRTPAPNYRGGPQELVSDGLATILNPWETDFDAVKDLVTGHPIDAGKRIWDGAITEGKAVINFGEDVFDGIKSLF